MLHAYINMTMPVSHSDETVHFSRLAVCAIIIFDFACIFGYMYMLDCHIMSINLYHKP